jgi:hypothetical protein
VQRFFFATVNRRVSFHDRKQFVGRHADSLSAVFPHQPP